ncbi:MAG TPA: hypothetical protein VJX92_06270 [Methylomirabilota bacterium]|nr:hypothetical protein [Methylomirabilota bacterium]
MRLPAPSVTTAEHEVAYRYTVLGYVMDGDNRARRGVRVDLVRDKTGFSYLGETDAQGFYMIITRLGDESEGETLSLRAESLTVSVAAHFDPADHATERGTRVDFAGRRALQNSAAFAPTLKRYLAQ